MDTVAVYLERPVRTYGVQARGGFVLVRVDCPLDRLPSLAAVLGGAQPSLKFTACAASWSKGRGGLTVCLPERHAAELAQLVREQGGQVADSREASLIDLQGPHFGDRWGIAEQALAALEEAGVEPLLLLGATHTLQVLVDPAAVPRALQGLRGRFSSPEAGHA